jgi:RNA polymerase sigma-70 factor (ECF subfamily)
VNERRGSRPEGFEDVQLATDFLARRSGALERIYRKHAGAFFSTARRILGSDDDAQDCVHDTLLRVWQRSGGYRPERGALIAYLLICVRNDAISRKRNAQRHRFLEERSVRSGESVYELEVPDHVEFERLRYAIETLPNEQRAALELAYFHNLSHTQISERLNVPLGTIKSRLSLALRKLQEAFL